MRIGNGTRCHKNVILMVLNGGKIRTKGELLFVTPEKWRNRTCGFGRISVHLTRHLLRVISLFREASKCIISGYAMTGIE
jgi:hypothetical protein